MDYFQRMNFFTGLVTTAKDWHAEQNYHIEKHHLLNCAVLTPGVIRGEIWHHDLSLKESLKVTVTGEGQIIVLPGYAVDARGRDLYLPGPVEVTSRLHAFLAGSAHKEVMLYLGIGFGQETFDRRVNVMNNDYKGDAFIRERPVIEWTDTEPDNEHTLELARVKCKAGQAVTQVDMSNVRLARTRHSGAQSVRVQAGEAELGPNPPGAGLVFAATDFQVRIQAFDTEAEAVAAVYVANVFPDLDQDAGDSRIFWRIESSVIETAKKKQIAYFLLLKNFGSKKVKVHYAVYRLNVMHGS